MSVLLRIVSLHSIEQREWLGASFRQNLWYCVSDELVYLSIGRC